MHPCTGDVITNNDNSLDEWAAVNGVRTWGFGPSGTWRRVSESGGPTDGQKCLHVQGSRGPGNLHGVISPKPKSCYVNTQWLGHPHVLNGPPVAVLNTQVTATSALCHSCTQQAISRSQTGRWAAEMCNISHPPLNPPPQQPDGCCMQKIVLSRRQ